MGEFATYSLGNELQITQGFHQGNLFITSLFSPSFSYEVNASPNPVNQLLRITTTAPAEVQITISDLTGRPLLHQIMQGEASLDVSQLPQGAYLLQLLTPDHQFYTALIHKF